MAAKDHKHKCKVESVLFGTELNESLVRGQSSTNHNMFMIRLNVVSCFQSSFLSFFLPWYFLVVVVGIWKVVFRAPPWCRRTATETDGSRLMLRVMQGNVTCISTAGCYIQRNALGIIHHSSVGGRLIPDSCTLIPFYVN